MPKIANQDVTGLERSIYRSGYSFMKVPPSGKEFRDAVFGIDQTLIQYLYDEVRVSEGLLEKDLKEIAEDTLYSNQHIKRAIKLANAKMGGEDQFLTGIKVDFDLTVSEKAWTQIQRYKFMDFVSSFSLMHRATEMDIAAWCNKYVYGNSHELFNKLLERYNNLRETSDDKDAIKEARLELLYNIPLGFELTAGMSTNYRCLKNIYKQRRHHALPDWQYICDWIEALPLAGYLITGRDVS